MDLKAEIEKSLLDALKKSINIQKIAKSIKNKSMVDTSTKKFGFSKLNDSNIRP